MAAVIATALCAGETDLPSLMLIDLLLREREPRMVALLVQALVHVAPLLHIALHSSTGAAREFNDGSVISSLSPSLRQFHPPCSAATTTFECSSIIR